MQWLPCTALHASLVAALAPTLSLKQVAWELSDHHPPIRAGLPWMQACC
jgi:hypothetical protein